MRADWKGVNLVATARSLSQAGASPNNQLVVNALYYDATLFGQRFSLGKKILSWDVGFGFRPLDVIQQENRRAIFPSTLEGIPYLAWEKFTADAAWMLVLANPGRGKAGAPKDDESLALKYFRNVGNTDMHAVMRLSQRNRFETGVALTSVAGEGLEWHASLLQQTRYEKALNTLASGSGVPLAVSDPVVTQSFRQGQKALVGGTWTGSAGISLLAEAWYDPNAYTRAEWRAASDLSRRQQTLLGMPDIAVADVRGNLAYGMRYFDPANLLQQNVLLRLSQQAEGKNIEPAIEVLITPEDGGHVITTSLGYEANRFRVDGGVRLYGGPAGSAYQLLPEKRVAYLALQLAF